MLHLSSVLGGGDGGDTHVAVVVDDDDDVRIRSVHGPLRHGCW